MHKKSFSKPTHYVLEIPEFAHPKPAFPNANAKITQQTDSVFHFRNRFDQIRENIAKKYDSHSPSSQHSFQPPSLPQIAPSTFSSTVLRKFQTESEQIRDSLWRSKQQHIPNHLAMSSKPNEKALFAKPRHWQPNLNTQQRGFQGRDANQAKTSLRSRTFLEFTSQSDSRQGEYFARLNSTAGNGAHKALLTQIENKRISLKRTKISNRHERRGTFCNRAVTNNGHLDKTSHPNGSRLRPVLRSRPSTPHHHSGPNPPPRPVFRANPNWKQQNLAAFNLPFTRSARALFQICKRPENFPASAQLTNLRRLIGAIFLWEGNPEKHLLKINQLERKVLLRILSKKKYDLKMGLISLVANDPQPGSVDLFRKMSRKKRKEENLKFSFRIMFSCLEKAFKIEVLNNTQRSREISDKDTETLFYLYHFAQSEFGINFDAAFEIFQDDLNFRKRATRAMTKFMFPEVHKQDCRAQSKSLNKGYFSGLSQAPHLVDQFNQLFLSSLFFLSRLSLTNRHEPDLRLANLQSSELLPNFFHQVVANNDVEIHKMFSEWDNLLRRDKICRSGASSESKSVQLLVKVGKNIEKPNFKFPWSAFEVRNALLEAFFWMNEHVHDFDTKDPFIPRQSLPF